MLENILAAVVLGTLVFGGVVASAVKHMSGKKSVSCREKHAEELIQKTFEKQEKKTDSYRKRYKKPAARKEDHAHGNV